MNWKAYYALARASAREASGEGEWRRGICRVCEFKTGKVDRRGAFCFNVQTGGFTCFKCGSNGKLRELDGSSYDDARQVKKVLVPEEDRECLRMPEGTHRLIGPGIFAGTDSIVCRPALQYLYGRGLDRQRIEDAHISACFQGRWAGRVIFPMYDAADGALAGYVGRAWSPTAEKPYLYPRGMNRAELLYNGAALARETSEPLIVVEGCFDTFPFWPDAVAVLGKPSHAQEALLAACNRPVAVVLDGDAWEDGRALAMRLRLAGQRAGAVQLPGGLDPDQVDPTELRGAARECIDI